jgi:hypothetical protein
MLDLVGILLRWDTSDTETASKCTFFYGKGNENDKLVTVFFT